VRDFRLFMVMIIASSLAQQAQGVAIGWDVYERTGSALALGWVGLVQFVPVLAFFLPAGQWADRYDRRKVAAISLVLWCAAAALLAFTSWVHASVAWIYLAVAATGLATVLNRAARDALLPQLVPDDMFARAVTWNSTLFQTASVAGPGLAGALIAAGGTALTVYVVNFTCLAIAAVTVLLIPPRAARVGKRVASWREVFGGMAHVWNTKIVLATMTIDLFAVLLGGATALLPVFAKDVLNVGPTGLGWLSAAPAAGAVLMALTVGHRKTPTHAGRTFVIAVAVFGFANVVFGLSTNYWLSLLMLIIVGASDNMGAVIRQTVVQLHTPDELRGRVSAVNRVFISSSNELGALRAGLQASLTGPVAAVVTGGAITMLIATAGLRLFPALRDLDTVHGKTEKP
jgi:MFS family permease